LLPVPESMYPWVMISRTKLFLNRTRYQASGSMLT
jgi:hypothetical protein